MRAKIFIAIVLFAISTLDFSQASFDNALQWQSIGPANMMARIAAVEVLNTDYRYVL